MLHSKIVGDDGDLYVLLDGNTIGDALQFSASEADTPVKWKTVDRFLRCVLIYADECFMNVAQLCPGHRYSLKTKIPPGLYGEDVFCLDF